MDASLDEIARRAGVASGTLYRHFPTRLDLVEAVLADQLAALADLGRELLTAEDEFGGLTTWLRAALVHGMSYRGLSAAVLNAAVDRGGVDVADWHAETLQVGGELLARARAAGSVDADVRDADVLKMVGAIAQAAGDGRDGHAQAERLLGLLMNGLRAGAPGH